MCVCRYGATCVRMCVYVCVCKCGIAFAMKLLKFLWRKFILKLSASRLGYLQSQRKQHQKQQTTTTATTRAAAAAAITTKTENNNLNKKNTWQLIPVGYQSRHLEREKERKSLAKLVAFSLFSQLLLDALAAYYVTERERERVSRGVWRRATLSPSQARRHCKLF